MLLAILALAAATRAATQEATGHGPFPDPDGPSYGVYDPARDFRNDSYVTIESIYFPWEDGEIAWLHDVDAYASNLGRTVMITVEPFSWYADEQKRPQDLRRDILGGRYDDTIDRICTEIATMRSPAWIRWGHEMETRSGRYPWSGWWPSYYAAAYRHVVTRCRRSAPDARYVWSPRGDHRHWAYFPGRDHVDIVGVSLYGLQPYQKATRGRDTDFVETFRPIYHRAAGYGLPVIIAEVGYSGGADYVRRWSDQIMRPNPEFPALKAVIYFNAIETGEWPLGFGQPDWRVYANIRTGVDRH